MKKKITKPEWEQLCVSLGLTKRVIKYNNLAPDWYQFSGVDFLITNWDEEHECPSVSYPIIPRDYKRIVIAPSGELDVFPDNWTYVKQYNTAQAEITKVVDTLKTLRFNYYNWSVNEALKNLD